jgi:hypothetical protein
MEQASDQAALAALPAEAPALDAALARAFLDGMRNRSGRDQAVVAYKRAFVRDAERATRFAGTARYLEQRFAALADGDADTASALADAVAVAFAGRIAANGEAEALLPRLQAALEPLDPPRQVELARILDQHGQIFRLERDTATVLECAAVRIAAGMVVGQAAGGEIPAPALAASAAQADRLLRRWSGLVGEATEDAARTGRRVERSLEKLRTGRARYAAWQEKHA